MKSVGYDLEQLKPSYIIGKKVKLYSHLKKKKNNCLAIPFKVKHRFTRWSNNITQVSPKRKENICTHRDLYIKMHSSTIHSSPIHSSPEV